jgi:Na+/H+ antiporter NhaC
VRALLVLIGTGFAAALLIPDADRDRLVARGVDHLLAANAGDFLASPGDEPVRARFRVDGVEVASPGLERTSAARLAEVGLRTSPDADRVIQFDVSTDGDRVSLRADGARLGDWPLPGRASLLPPLIAVGMALLLRGALLALLAGVYAGAVVLAAQAGSAFPPLRGLWDVVAVYFAGELVDAFRIEIIGFIAVLVAMIGVVSRAGGVRAMLDMLLVFARSVRSGLLLTYASGLAIFFDDYANCMLVGSTMRPLTDRLRVSREKLAYIVDSTAAPVAGISLLSTWIAFQVSVYSPQLPEVGIADSGYAVFLQTLPYRFYCLLTLGFAFLVIATGRDFGPMATAEARARRTGQLVRPGGRPPISDELGRIEPAPGAPHDWRIAALPVALTLAVTLWRIFADGGGLALLESDPDRLLSLAGLTQVMLDGSGPTPIFAGGVAGLLCAVFLAGGNGVRLAVGLALVGWALAGVAVGAAAGVVALVAARRLGLRTARPHISEVEIGRACAASARTLAFAVVLLFAAWMIGGVCRDLSTADYLVALLSDVLPPNGLPVLLFALACLVAFATGSSWSTMSILLPSVIGLAATLGETTALGAHGMVVLSISAVLEGSIFGDHCSPISDTTVLSSVASGSDHVDHVRTQAPYALCAALAAVGFGYAPLLLVPGWSAGLGLVAGAAALAALLFLLGRPCPPPLAEDENLQ